MKYNAATQSYFIRKGPFQVAMFGMACFTAFAVSAALKNAQGTTFADSRVSEESTDFHNKFCSRPGEQKDNIFVDYSANVYHMVSKKE